MNNRKACKSPRRSRRERSQILSAGESRESPRARARKLGSESKRESRLSRATRLNVASLSCLLLWTLAGCAVIQVETDYDPAADFSGLRTYAWAPLPPKEVRDPRKDTSFLDARIRHAVDTQLTGKGFRQVDSEADDDRGDGDEADLIVTYQTSVETKTDVDTVERYETFGGPLGGRRRGPGRRHGHFARPWIGYVETETRTYEYEEGSFILDLVNPKTQRLLWRGWARAVIERGSSPEKRTERISEAVRRLFAEFPPG